MNAALAALLAIREPAATGEFSWLDGAMPLRVTAYDEPAELPAELITSVRCIVQVGDLIVLCTNKDGSHPWPGGRREPGETYAETAVREVHEETGWFVDPASLRQLGWLHLHHLAPLHPDNAGPYPDLLQLVLHGTAAERDGDPARPWTDTEGYELESRLVPLAVARAEPTTELLAQVFLDLLR